MKTKIMKTTTTMMDIYMTFPIRTHVLKTEVSQVCTQVRATPPPQDWGSEGWIYEGGNFGTQDDGDDDGDIYEWGGLSSGQNKAP